MACVYVRLGEIYARTYRTRCIDRISVHGHCAIPTIIVRFIDIGGIVDHHCVKLIS
jgi:hypothetical protein